MKVLARDDCFTFYLVSAFQRFGTPFTLLCYDEKIPSPIFMDALQGIHSDPAVVLPALSEPYFYKTQRELKSLSVKDANLIIIGSFSDLAIRLYRHRTQGWKFAERWNFVSDPQYLETRFERLDPTPIRDVVENNKILFDVFGKNNPQAKKLWINYPYVDGAPTGWNGVETENRIMKDRWKGITEATSAEYPSEGVFVLNIPDELAEGRGDGQLWHYPDRTYDWAAKAIFDWFNSK